MPTQTPFRSSDRGQIAAGLDGGSSRAPIQHERTRAGCSEWVQLPRERLMRASGGAQHSQDILLPPARTMKKARQPSLANFEIQIGPPKLTRFEKARIIGARSLQIAMGAPPFVPLEGRFRGPIDIATAELEEDALPLSIRRALPNGVTQDIPIKALQK